MGGIHIDAGLEPVPCVRLGHALSSSDSEHRLQECVFSAYQLWNQRLGTPGMLCELWAYGILAWHDALCDGKLRMLPK